MRTLHLIIFLILSFCCMECTQSISPGSSDHGNAKISGTLQKSNGDAATETMVLLLPDTTNYYTDSATLEQFKLETDSYGYFTIDSIPEGTYCLFADDPWSGNNFFMKKIMVRNNTTIDLETLDMSRPGTISFDIHALGIAPGCVLYFPGLPLYQTVDTAAIQWINGVPSTDTVILQGYDPKTGTNVIFPVEFREVEVPSGKSVFIPYRIPQPWHVSGDSTLTRELNGTVGMSYRFCAVDPAAVAVDTRTRYRFSWGDSTISPWSTNYYAFHTWENENFYHIQTQIMIGSTVLAWSEGLTIHISEKDAP